MELFKIAGKFVLDGKEKVKKDLEESANEGKKTSTVFEKIGAVVSKAFKNDKVKAFGTSLEKLTSKVTNQQTKLDLLKRKYADLYLTQGKNSEEAKECAKEIEKLSKELQENKSKLEEAAKAANKFDNALDDAADSADEAGSQMPDAFRKIGAAVVAAFTVDKIVDFGAAITDASATVAAEQSAFEQIMGDYSTTAQEKVNEIADATGMVDTRLTPYMTSMTAKFKGLGYDIDAATDLASDGLTLAADAAAFWDKSLDDSMSALNSFINGSYEGGEAIGLFANDTQLAQYAIKAGLVDTTAAWSSLDEATKQATRLDYAKAMFDQSGATGQASKEAEQYANVQANLTEKWRQFKAQIGEPLLQKIVLPAMEKLSGTVDKLSPAFEKLKKWVGENKTTLKVLGGVVVALTSAFAAYKTVTGAVTLATKAAAAAQKLLNIAQTASPIGLIIAGITALVAAFIYLWNNCEGFRKFFIKLWNSIKKVVGAVVDWFVNAWKNVSSFFKGLWDGMKKVVDDVVTWIKTNWQAMLLFLINPLAGIFKYCYDNFEGFRDFVDSIVEDVIGFFKNLWKSVSGFFEELGADIKSIWDGIWGGIKSVINSIIGGINGMISAVCSGINAVIRAANTLSWEIPDWVPYVGGETFGFDIDEVDTPEIPELARGGVVSKPTFAQIGEDGAEAVIPLENNTGWIDGVAERLNALQGGTPANIKALLAKLDAILAAILGVGNFKEALNGTALKINDREFARLVKGVG